MPTLPSSPLPPPPSIFMLLVWPSGKPVLSGRKGEAMHVTGTDTSPEFWVGVGGALVTMVRTIHKIGEEGRNRFPTILKRK